MTDKKLFKLALDALEQMKAKANFECWNLDVCDEAITALKERLADPMRGVQRLGQEIEQDFHLHGEEHLVLRQAIWDSAEIVAQGRFVNMPEQEPVAKPYAYEYGRCNADGTYSVVIEKGDLVQTSPAVYNYVRPQNAHKDWPIKELFDRPQRTEQEPVDYEKLAVLGWQAIECGICGGGAMGYPQRTEQEPVAWQWLGSAHFRKKLPKNADVTAWNPLYSAPQRTEQEPVAWGVFEGNLHDMFFTQEEAHEMVRLKGSHAEVKPLYTHPPQRTERSGWRKVQIDDAEEEAWRELEKKNDTA